jgi:hypothetical protein
LREAEKPRILYYAFGGGLGHLTRSTALLRKLVSGGGSEILCLTNSPYHALYGREKIPYRNISKEDLPDLRTLKEWIRREIRSFRPNVLVVDTFPGGIVGELEEVLADGDLRKVLIRRRLRSRTTASESTLRTYHLCIECEERLERAKAENSLYVGPILVRDFNEILPFEQARRHLRAGESARLMLVVSSSRPERRNRIFRLLFKIWRRLEPPRPHIRFCTPSRPLSEIPGEFWIFYYPLLELFRGIDLLVGAAGCNLSSEVAATGLPSILLPEERRFDDQARRTEELGPPGSPEELEAAVRNALAESGRNELSPFQNGATAAASAILNLAREDLRKTRSRSGETRAHNAGHPAPGQVTPL